MLKIILYTSLLLLTIYSINAMNGSVVDLDENLANLEWDTILNPSKQNNQEEESAQNVPPNIIEDLKKNEPIDSNDQSIEDFHVNNASRISIPCIKKPCKQNYKYTPKTLNPTIRDITSSIRNHCDRQHKINLARNKIKKYVRDFLEQNGLFQLCRK